MKGASSSTAVSNSMSETMYTVSGISELGRLKRFPTSSISSKVFIISVEKPHGVFQTFSIFSFKFLQSSMLMNEGLLLNDINSL